MPKNISKANLNKLAHLIRKKQELVKELESVGKDLDSLQEKIWGQTYHFFDEDFIVGALEYGKGSAITGDPFMELDEFIDRMNAAKRESDKTKHR